MDKIPTVHASRKSLVCVVIASFVLLQAAVGEVNFRDSLICGFIMLRIGSHEPSNLPVSLFKPTVEIVKPLSI